MSPPDCFLSVVAAGCSVFFLSPDPPTRFLMVSITVCCVYGFVTRVSVVRVLVLVVMVLLMGIRREGKERKRESGVPQHNKDGQHAGDVL